MPGILVDTDLPYLDIASPEFAMNSEAVRDARSRSWVARTNYGFGVLRYREVTELLKHPSLNQGSAKWPELNGVHSGLFHEWWSKNLLVLEGDEHHRIRRLLNPAFSPTQARRLEPEFAQIATELIDEMVALQASGAEVDFVAAFAEPFATRALCAMLGLSHEHWPFIADRANTVGYALAVSIKDDIERIDVAVQELYDFVEQLITERRANPGQDVVSRLVQFSADGDKLSDAELRNALVLMLFGGMDGYNQESDRPHLADVHAQSGAVGEARRSPRRTGEAGARRGPAGQPDNALGHPGSQRGLRIRGPADREGHHRAPLHDVEWD